MNQPQRKIVIIDPSEKERDLLCRYLVQDRRYHYQLWESESAEGGWELCQQVKPDAILLNVRLLDAQGIEVWQQGYDRAQERRDGPVTIALRDGNRDREMAIAVEDCLLEEEVTPSLLWRVVDGAIERRRLQRELARSRASQQLSVEIARQMGRGMQTTEMLAMVATRARQVLDCDRLSIYQFERESSGGILAESVVPGYASVIPTLQQGDDRQAFECTIGNNCQETFSLTDIDESDLSEPVRQWCKQLPMKASLSTPILLPSGTRSRASQKPWGFLIAHQCAAPRIWQLEERERLEALALYLAISLERAHLLEDSQQERQTQIRLRRECQNLEERLRASDERCNLAAEALQSIIYDWDIELDRVARTGGQNQLLGCRVEESEPTRDWWNQRIHPDDLARVREEVQEVFSPGEQINYAVEYRIRQENGQYIGVRDRGIVLRDERRIPRRAVGTVRALDNLPTLSPPLEPQKEAHLLQSCFVSMVSHEFRNPLNSISGIAQMLELYDTRLPAVKKQELFRRMQQAIERMLQLLDEVLLVGRADAGKLEFKPSRLNLERICRGAIAEVHIEDIEATKIDFTYRGKKEAKVDENLLRHILVNLLSNAIKYSPEQKSIQFDVACDLFGILFKITDRGIGIPLEDRHHLFSIFHRASNVGSIQGTGLGLAIVKQCVELHGGKIEVASEIGRGTTFTIALPFL